MGLTNKKVNCNMLPHHLSSHTENLCYKKCRHKDFTSESYRAYTWRQCESAGHNSRSCLNMFFVQMFAGISLLAFQFGIVCTCNCFLLLEYKVYIRMEHLITYKRIFKLSIKMQWLSRQAWIKTRVQWFCIVHQLQIQTKCFFLINLLLYIYLKHLTCKF